MTRVDTGLLRLAKIGPNKLTMAYSDEFEVSIANNTSSPFIVINDPRKATVQDVLVDAEFDINPARGEVLAVEFFPDDDDTADTSDSTGIRVPGTLAVPDGKGGYNRTPYTLTENDRITVTTSGTTHHPLGWDDDQAWTKYRWASYMRFAPPGIFMPKGRLYFLVDDDTP